ncbi:unnamed protein product [Prunus brigantina]
MVNSCDETIVLSVQPDWDLIEDPGWDLIEEVRPRPILTHSAPARRRRSSKEKILDSLHSIWKKTLKISKEFLGPLLPIWNKIFVISCVFAVLMDPLFFYTPVINEDMKCLELDKSLKEIALALRSVTDLFYLVDIIFQIYQLNVTSKISINGATFRLERVKSAKKILLSCIVIDTFAVLPVPQIVFFIFFTKRRGPRSFVRMFMNSLILFQYVPRVLRIYLSGNTPSIQTRVGILVKAVFNFFPFILAGHILGGIWYFFAIQRERTCWEYGCRENGCGSANFDCNDNIFRNVTLLNILCPTNPPNATLFDFGIFLGAVQSDMLRSTNFSKKLLQCFWWGLRNLSSLGQNLEPSSSNQWENVFAVLTLLSGMMLFLIYLNATLQTLSVQLEKIRSDERIFRRKMQLISPEIDLWLSKNDLPKDLKMVSGRTEKHLRTVIVENVQRHLQENKDVDVENILAVLPLRHRRGIMSLLRLTSLKKVSMLESMDEKVLKAISEHLKLETYNEGSYIVPEGEPLEKMMFITQGTAWSYPPTPSSKDGITITSPNTKWLEKGDFYGEELLIWALKSTPSSELPMSTRILKSQTKVEAFAIRAKDLKTIVAKFWWHFRAELRHLEEFQLEHWRNLAASSVQENWRRYCARANKRKLRNWRSKFIQIN